VLKVDHYLEERHRLGLRPTTFIGSSGKGTKKGHVIMPDSEGANGHIENDFERAFKRGGTLDLATRRPCLLVFAHVVGLLHGSMG
jgi:hypothetical protein